jgi:hypothetical protein
MKKSFYVLMMIGCALNLMFTVSCNKTKTYEELKRDEKKVIQRMINEKNITVLSEYPSDGVFGEKEFVELSNGIYLHVVDSGNGNRAVLGQTDVLVRVSGDYYYKDSLMTFNTFVNEGYPFEFKYGNAYSVVMSNATSDNYYYYYFGSGIESVLSYVGEGAVVKMIVPGYSEINSYPAGSTFQSANTNEYIPLYYDRVRFTYY